MDRKKIIYIGSILLVTVFVSVTYFSYAFFTSKNEYHGKVNMVVGTLDYKLSSSLLSNNSITLSAYEKARLNIEVESLNEINSKYELYYTTTNNNIEIGYNTTNDLPTGTINAKAKKTVTVIIKNPSDTSATVTFGVQGGFTYNTLALETGKKSLTQIQSSYCEVAANEVFNYDYTGNSQEFTTPCSGNYKLEIWGAQGGSTVHAGVTGDDIKGGYGGYSVGTIDLNSNDKIYIFVGQEGPTGRSFSDVTEDTIKFAYPNGGAVDDAYGTYNIYFNGGGGSTHIAYQNKLISELNNTNLIMVAGGGGGVSNYWRYGDNGGAGGGYIGGSTTTNFSNINATGGTQTEGGLGGGNQDGHQRQNEWLAGNFGIGGGKFAWENSSVNVSGGGGGGYYGGGASWGGSGAGGSGYIKNSNLTNKAMYCYGCGENDDTDTYTVSTTGSSNLRDTTNCPNGYSSNPVSKCAKVGNGYAKITFLGESIKEEKAKLNYVVLFNANGGTVGVSNKVVAYNSNYGELPTPTRSGYTFKGWNGKNLFNKEFFKDSSIYTDNTIDVGWAYLSSYHMSLKGNKSYTVSLKTNNFIPSNGWLYRVYDGSKSVYVELQRYVTEDLTKTLNTDANGNIYIGHLYGFGTDSNYEGVRMNYYLGIVDIQLEEGNVATTYEPFYISSNTKVTQNKNHTLTAIWEPNS